MPKLSVEPNLTTLLLHATQEGKPYNLTINDHRFIQ